MTLNLRKICFSLMRTLLCPISIVNTYFPLSSNISCGFPLWFLWLPLQDFRLHDAKTQLCESTKLLFPEFLFTSPRFPNPSQEFSFGKKCPKKGTTQERWKWLFFANQTPKLMLIIFKTCCSLLMCSFDCKNTERPGALEFFVTIR